MNRMTGAELNSMFRKEQVERISSVLMSALRLFRTQIGMARKYQKSKTASVILAEQCPDRPGGALLGIAMERLATQLLTGMGEPVSFADLPEPSSVWPAGEWGRIRCDESQVRLWCYRSSSGAELTFRVGVNYGH